MVSFKYEKKEIEFTSGYILKSKRFRVSIIKFPSLYLRAEIGTEVVELYHFEPKESVVGSVLLLHGLGTMNIPFLLWMGMHLANAGVRTVVPVLPGNFTRTSHGSVSGKDYFSADIDKATRYWEHAVVDCLTTIDFMKKQTWWSENNCLVGYCLGGMIAVMLNALVSDLKQTILVTAGGDLSTLVWHSPTLAYVRKEMKRFDTTASGIGDEENLKRVFKSDIEKLKTFKNVDEMLNSDIHPLLKIDPVAYARFSDSSKLTLIEGVFDRALPPSTRKILWEHLGKPKRYFVPVGHVTWLPFQFFLGSFVLKKMNIREFKRRLRYIEKPKIEEK